jgi:uncharacterized membrane protein YkvA (DUF1232 family)
MPGDTLFQRARRWAREIKRDVLALWLAARDPRVPWYVKALCAGIAAYALSPIDLIPDFVPVLGYLDDVILLPLAIMLAVRMLPTELLAELRTEAERLAKKPSSRAAAAAIIALWIISAALLFWLIWPKLGAN